MGIGGKHQGYFVLINFKVEIIILFTSSAEIFKGFAIILYEVGFPFKMWDDFRFNRRSKLFNGVWIFLPFSQSKVNFEVSSLSH